MGIQAKNWINVVTKWGPECRIWFHDRGYGAKHTVNSSSYQNSISKPIFHTHSSLGILFILMWHRYTNYHCAFWSTESLHLSFSWFENHNQYMCLCRTFSTGFRKQLWIFPVITQYFSVTFRWCLLIYFFYFPFLFGRSLGLGWL